MYFTKSQFTMIYFCSYLGGCLFCIIFYISIGTVISDYVCDFMGNYAFLQNSRETNFCSKRNDTHPNVIITPLMIKSA